MRHAPWPETSPSLQSRTRPGAARYSCGQMAFDRTRTLRGALAGRVAAAVWLAQQPLDKQLFDSGYDDADLLGRLVARGGSRSPAVGALCTSQNGALFGAAVRERRAQPAGPRAAARAARRAARARRHAGRRSRWSSRRLLGSGRARSRSRPGGTCCSGRARRARAPAEPARGRPRAGQRGGGRLQRPRLGGAPGRGSALSARPDHRRLRLRGAPPRPRPAPPPATT